MKKWIIMFTGLFLLLTALPVAAQDEAKSAVFGGGTYSGESKTFGTSIGYGHKAYGLWWIAHGKVGDSVSSFEAEIGKFFTVYKKLTVAVLAGPNADWTKNPESATGSTSPLSYLSGAAGGLIGLHWSRAGGYIGGKFKVSASDLASGWTVGAWLVFNP